MEDSSHPFPFMHIKWYQQRGTYSGEYLPSKDEQEIWVSIQGNIPNKWRLPSEEQLEAIIWFESHILWLINANELSGTEFRHGKFIFLIPNRLSLSYYILDGTHEHPKHRKVLKIPPHTGAKSDRQTMSSNVAANIGSLGAIYDKIAL